MATALLPAAAPGNDDVEVPWGGEHTLEVRVFRCPERRAWPAHQHGEHELVWCAGGVVTVDVGDRRWRLTAGSVLFVPGRHAHAVTGAPGAAFSCVFLRRSTAFAWTAPTRVVATPMLGELLRYLARPEVVDAARHHAETVVFDLLRPLAGDESVRLPTDPRARAVTDALCADPADSRRLDQWGRSVGASARTLTRLFQDELGTSFQDWRADLRVRVACGLLASGASVAEAALAVGFSTPSAFAERFRQLVGVAPRDYQRAHRAA